MHLYVSEQIRKKYGFSNEFLAGSILPDVKKLAGEGRDKTHFLVEKRKNRVTLSLPEVEDYIEKSKSEGNSEIRLGYLAHLIEDKIWFKDYMPVYGDVVGVDQDKDELYACQEGNHKVIKTHDEFVSEIYSDYGIWNPILMSKYGILDYEKIEDILFTQIGNSNMKKMISGYINEQEEDKKIKFITRENMDSYFEKCFNEVTKTIDKMIK